MTLADSFRAFHIPGEPFVMPNPWDVGSAKILESLGFQALATTSSGHAHSIGRPDGARSVSRDEAIAHARDIVEATPLPVNGDLERGYGDSPDDCAATIAAAGGAGLAGASIEDATSDPEDPIYAFDLALARVEAAVEAARAVPDGFVLTARAEAYLWGLGDIGEVIERLIAFEEAGADVLYAPGLPDLDTVKAITDAVSVPVNVLAHPSWTTHQMADAGAARISVGSGMSRAAYGALVRAAEEVLDGGSFRWAMDALPFGRIQEILGD